MKDGKLKMKRVCSHPQSSILDPHLDSQEFDGFSQVPRRAAGAHWRPRIRVMRGISNGIHP